MYQPSKEEEMRYLREAREEYYRRQKRNERIEAEFKVTKEEIVRRRITIGCNSKLKSRLTPIRPRGLACNCTFLSA